jgi:cytochrome c biogenesis protein CcmG/thiol:disulfide interchange protein DsbE
VSGPLSLPRLPRRPRSILLAVVLVAAVVAGALAATASGQPGQRRPPTPAKSFTLSELGHPGGHVALAAFAGQPVVLNFFASWCAPCKRETPLLARFYATHHSRVAIIGIDANDQTTAALKFVRAEKVGYPVGVDPFPASTATSYGVLALPQTFFLNARHQIVRHIAGDVTARELSAWAASSASHPATAAGKASSTGDRS